MLRKGTHLEHVAPLPTLSILDHSEGHIPIVVEAQYDVDILRLAAQACQHSALGIARLTYDVRISRAKHLGRRPRFSIPAAVRTVLLNCSRMAVAVVAAGAR